MVEKLIEGNVNRNSCFAERAIEKEISTADTDVPIQRWNKVDRCQLCHEALQWLDRKGDKIVGLCFKKDRHSMQSGMKKFGDKGKE